ncbi:MAG: phenylalanine--tRNA ligase subunit beta [Candidatus Omnitrophica bacterium CG11_big_fil_rev_8_21_14_0_20_43_6]|nr:MAG: phenylalanine--tRNA ligase subunit beta [Candidatus Omnitrophica bacterium CG11_big_fil_rev_8_21_14_0_20_43_6]
MKVTYNWLKNFVDLKISPKELAEKLTMAGLEVVGLEKAGDDFVLEVEITSNRPDWLSVLGIAREVSALTGLKLKTTGFKEPKIKPKDFSPIKISVASKQDCPFYSARIMSGLAVGPSPEWLKNRLEALGCRTVNNIVDITNYCLFELGQPLHAFDLDKLPQKEIRVRRAKPEEKIITIDGQTRLLNPEILVIADTHHPIAIAGIMGGRETEVTFKTRNILLESAVFNPVLVRRAKQKLGLQSESAYRFERGVDLEGARQASRAAQELILKLASGKACGSKSLGATKAITPAINLEIAYLNKLLGTAISGPKAKQILSRLGLAVKTKSRNILTVKVPSFRQDLRLPVDLVEEVARIYGYEQIPQTLPAVKPGRKAPDDRDLIAVMKNILCGLGLSEAITYSLIDRHLLKQSGINIDTGLVEIANPLSREQEILRPGLLPSLTRALAYNLDQQQEKVCIFEIACAFSGQPAAVAEKPLLGIALCGVNTFFTKHGLAKDEITLLHLKGILETLFVRLGIKDFDFAGQPDNKINIMINQKPAGFLLKLAPQILGAFDIKNRQVVLAQVNLERLLKEVNLARKFLDIPKYPAITRDISFLINEDVSVKELLGAIQAKGAPLLNQAKIVDYYRGKQIPLGFRGLTVSCLYRQDNRTLTEDEVSPVHNSICSLLTERFGIKLR